MLSNQKVLVGGTNLIVTQSLLVPYLADSLGPRGYSALLMHLLLQAADLDPGLRHLTSMPWLLWKGEGACLHPFHPLLYVPKAFLH